MKGVGNIGALLKRHWEKLVLALALVVLIGAVVYLNQMNTDEFAKIEDYERGVARPKVKQFPVVDVNMLSSAVRQATNPPTVDLSPPHNLINPVKWQQRPTGERIKAETGTELGIRAVVISKVAPLSTIITLDSQAGSGVQMTVTQQAATNRVLQMARRDYVTTNSSTERVHRSSGGVFTMNALRITDAGPEADIELKDGTRVTVTPAKPFNKVEGYKVDLSYPPERQEFKERRIGDSLTVAGEQYIIVAIKEDEVVISARSNDRRTIIQNKTNQ